MPHKAKIAKSKLPKVLVEAIANDPCACELFSQAWTSEGRQDFLEYVRLLAAGCHARNFSVPGDLFSAICVECSKSGAPMVMNEANQKRLSGSRENRHQKKIFIINTGFTERGRNKQAVRLKGIERLDVKALTDAYPPMGHWVCETASIERKWQKHLQTGRQPDARLPRLPLHFLQKSRLTHDIGPLDSASIYDADTGELEAIVVREFCPNPKVLEPVNNIIEEAVIERKSIRVSSFIFEFIFALPFLQAGGSWIVGPTWILGRGSQFTTIQLGTQYH